MSEPFITGAGAVISADIAVPEHEREMRFYSRVLSTGQSPLWREKDLMNNLGIPVIGLGARSPEHAHLPLQWMPHIQVADVAASVIKTMQGEEGQYVYAAVQDPVGAYLALMSG